MDSRWVLGKTNAELPLRITILCLIVPFIAACSSEKSNLGDKEEAAGEIQPIVKADDAPSTPDAAASTTTDSHKKPGPPEIVEPPAGELEALESFDITQDSQDLRVVVSDMVIRKGDWIYEHIETFSNMGDPDALVIETVSTERHKFVKLPYGRTIASGDGRAVAPHAPVEVFTSNLKSIYVGGLLERKSTVRFEQKKPRYVGSYQGGKRSGPWLKSFDNGNVRVFGSYSDGKRHGAFAVNYEDGTRGWEGEYSQDQLVRSTAHKPEDAVPGAPDSIPTEMMWRSDVSQPIIQASRGGRVRGVRDIAYSTDGLLLASCGSGEQADLWNTETGGLVAHLCVDPAPEGAPRSPDRSAVAFGPNGKWLASTPMGGSSSPTHLWDVTTYELGHSIPASGSCVAFTSDGALLTVDGFGLIDTSTGAQQVTLPCKTQAFAVAISPDGRHMARGTAKEIEIWSIRDQTLEQTLRGHSGRITGVAFQPDGSSLISAADSTLKLWDLNTGEPTKSVTAHETNEKQRNLPSVLSVDLGSDGLIVASGGSDGKAKLWDAASLDLLETFELSSGRALCVALSPDGKTLATGDDNGFVRFWDFSDVRQRLNAVEETRAAAARRVWTDASGEHQISAEFLVVEGGNVKLKKEDGTIVSLSLAKLSEDDQSFVRDQVEARSGDSRPDGKNDAERNQDLKGVDATRASGEELRVWSDASGQFSIEATLVKCKVDEVTLQKADGSEIRLPLERLSEKDQRYVRTQMKKAE